MAKCIITATTGNYARLRRFHLADRAVRSTDHWPSYRADAFTPAAVFEPKNLFRTPDGHVLVAPTTDEEEPQQARYAPARVTTDRRRQTAEGCGDHPTVHGNR